MCLVCQYMCLVCQYTCVVCQYMCVVCQYTCVVCPYMCLVCPYMWAVARAFLPLVLGWIETSRLLYVRRCGWWGRRVVGESVVAD